MRRGDSETRRQSDGESADKETAKRDQELPRPLVTPSPLLPVSPSPSAVSPLHYRPSLV